MLDTTAAHSANTCHVDKMGLLCLASHYTPGECANSWLDKRSNIPFKAFFSLVRLLFRAEVQPRLHLHLGQPSYFPGGPAVLTVFSLFVFVFSTSSSPLIKNRPVFIST